MAALEGLTVPNREGHVPLIDNDPTRPNEAYFRHVDSVLAQAESLGLYIGLLPIWGDKWNRKRGVGPVVFTPDNAAVYGEWLGQRYAGRNVIWITEGDRPIETDERRAIVEAMARGLRKGDGGKGLITFHPQGGQGSAQYFHEADWLDFNMRQNGHEIIFSPRYLLTREDYDRTSIKPVLDDAARGYPPPGRRCSGVSGWGVRGRMAGFAPDDAISERRWTRTESWVA